MGGYPFDFAPSALARALVAARRVYRGRVACSTRGVYQGAVLLAGIAAPP
jgi:hypothetical protein